MCLIECFGIFFRLHRYSYSNVHFECEESSFDWCGSPSRACNNKQPSFDHPWSFCSDQYMTPRLASALFSLAELVKEKWPGSNDNKSD